MQKIILRSLKINGNRCIQLTINNILSAFNGLLGSIAQFFKLSSTHSFSQQRDKN